MFRSIDSNSAKGFPKDPRAATMKVTVIYHLAMLYLLGFSILILNNSSTLANRILFVERMCLLT